MTSDILANLRVIEFGEGIAVPYCGKLLADFGADVIKIEKPGEGDRTRRHGPFPADVPHPERSGLFLALNTNKRGITLEPGSPTGRQLLEALLQGADVLLHQNVPDMAAAHQLQTEALRRAWPRLVVTGVTPYGQFGPYSRDQGTELTSCALSGLSEGLGERVRRWWHRWVKQDIRLDSVPPVRRYWPYSYATSAVKGKRLISRKPMCSPRYRQGCI
jgi:crotonobetainyl-CoA:carnitine CoA-transferase CaiB-like acyl-CoA transferase